MDRSRDMTIMTAMLLSLLTATWAVAQPVAGKEISTVRQRLTDGRQTRIVCFGDSITGVYYHTGSQRAWCDMLGHALQKANPRAHLQMINAGISGHTTVNAMARIERDVIVRNPHLVVVKFGMNDVVRVPLETFRSNMREIVARCRAAGAAVVLCTPNGVSTNAARPEEKLSLFADVVRSIASEQQLPLVDFLQDWQQLRNDDPVAWSLMMSDAIHPNMNGHVRFAELIAKAICEKEVSLGEPPPPFDALKHTMDRLHDGKAVKIVAMSPYDQIIPKLLQRHFPEAEFAVTVWPTDGQSATSIREWAKRIRELKPHLVVPAIPLETLKTPQESFIPDYEWILNFSFQFAGRPWDVVPVLPLELDATTDLQRTNLAHARRILAGKDVRFIERGDSDDKRTIEDIVQAWIMEQKRSWQGTENVLPPTSASVRIPAQPWPYRPGPRAVQVSVHYPGGQLSNVDEHTGIMLTLHNWGGEDCAGTANPNALAERLNVVAVCVNYLQSGRVDSVESPEPYDYGYLQATDVLRALAYVRSGLKRTGTRYDDHRIFCTGGSGGGNVTLMANKLAPRTFACVIDMCGMKKLSDDIAFHLPGGSGLNARWSRDRQSVNYLSTDAQEIRFVANPAHLRTMKSLDSRCKIVVVHGRADNTCPFADAQELVSNMQMADLDVEHHFIGSDDLDGKVFTSSGHALGNRTEIVFQVAGDYLRTEGRNAVRRAGKSDFDLREDIAYPTTNGRFVISYATGLPVAEFQASPSE